MIGGREAVFRQAEDGNDLVGESKVPRVRRDHLRRGGVKREDAVDGDGLFPVGDAAL